MPTSSSPSSVVVVAVVAAASAAALSLAAAVAAGAPSPAVAAASAAVAAPPPAEVVRSGDGWVWYCLGACEEDYDEELAHQRTPQQRRRRRRAFLPATAASVAPTPGLQLAGGGTDSDEAFKWAVQRAGAGGHFVVVRSTGTDAYNPWIWELAGGSLASVSTLIINATAGGNAPFCDKIIRRATALFIAGGDQYNYVRYFNGTSPSAPPQLIRGALNDLLAGETKPAAGVFGGTSAGLAVQGGYVFTAAEGTVTSEEAVEDPCGRRMAVGENFLRDELLQWLVTDSHFAERDRMGRLVAFLANVHLGGSPDWPVQPPHNGAPVRAMGVDEGVTFIVDPENGHGRVVSNRREGDGAVYLLQSQTRPTSKCGQPIDIGDVKTVRVRVGGVFDLEKWKPIKGDRHTHEYVLHATRGRLGSTGNDGKIY